MSYFPDLSPYTYGSSPKGVVTRNVGWLDSKHGFPTAVAAEQTLEHLWQFCMVSVWPARGGELCWLCDDIAVTERHGIRRVFGSAEILVFNGTGRSAYAAPNLVYHYVAVHQYSPPPEFLEAMASGPRPGSPEHRKMLKRSRVRWVLAKHDELPFWFVKRDGEVVREEWVPKSKV